ncbi:MAG: hypothetical protein EBU49_00495 [Proteobacteria bacterium]|nr:hypothetical protein [Pseudomonadota bacterium]
MAVTTLMKLKEVIARIEAILADYYGFEIELSAGDCLLAFEPGEPGAAPQGEMLVVEESELYVGLKFSHSTVEQAVVFEEAAPFTAPRMAALLVIIEEVSHFHLLTQRAQFDLATTRLELEWQAEVDKLIVLPELAGECGARVVLRGLQHFMVLGFKLREGLTPEESLRYLEATRYFDRLWQEKLVPQLSHGMDFGMREPVVRDKLRQLYRLPWSEKTTIIAA